jgi:hypothetical protein
MSAVQINTQLNWPLSSASLNYGAGILNTKRALQNTPSAPGGRGGGCSIMPFDANSDVSLLPALLAVGVYWLRRRMVSARSAA